MILQLFGWLNNQILQIVITYLNLDLITSCTANDVPLFDDVVAFVLEFVGLKLKITAPLPINLKIANCTSLEIVRGGGLVRVLLEFVEVGGVVDILLEFDDEFIEGIDVDEETVDIADGDPVIELFVLLEVDEFEDGPVVVTDTVTFELEDELVAGLAVVDNALDEIVAEVVDEPFVLLEVEEFEDELVEVVDDILLDFEGEIAVGLAAVTAGIVVAKNVLFEVVVGLVVPNISKMPVLLVEGIDVLLITRFVIVVVGKVEFVGIVVMVELFNMVAVFKNKLLYVFAGGALLELLVGVVVTGAEPFEFVDEIVVAGGVLVELVSEIVVAGSELFELLVGVVVVVAELFEFVDGILGVLFEFVGEVVAAIVVLFEFAGEIVVAIVVLFEFVGEIVFPDILVEVDEFVTGITFPTAVLLELITVAGMLVVLLTGVLLEFINEVVAGRAVIGRGVVTLAALLELAEETVDNTVANVLFELVEEFVTEVGIDVVAADALLEFVEEFVLGVAEILPEFVEEPVTGMTVDGIAVVAAAVLLEFGDKFVAAFVEVDVTLVLLEFTEIEVELETVEAILLEFVEGIVVVEDVLLEFVDEFVKEATVELDNPAVDTCIIPQIFAFEMVEAFAVTFIAVVEFNKAEDGVGEEEFEEELVTDVGIGIVVLFDAEELFEFVDEVVAEFVAICVAKVVLVELIVVDGVVLLEFVDELFTPFVLFGIEDGLVAESALVCIETVVLFEFELELVVEFMVDCVVAGIIVALEFVGDPALLELVDVELAKGVVPVAFNTPTVGICIIPQTFEFEMLEDIGRPIDRTELIVVV
uniref:Uncharacterized protein n=1 Tax=Meloidogyne javanica TaxID=6303 RepID=A0A915LR19_MELJA